MFLARQELLGSSSHGLEQLQQQNQQIVFYPVVLQQKINCQQMQNSQIQQNFQNQQIQQNQQNQQNQQIQQTQQMQASQPNSPIQQNQSSNPPPGFGLPKTPVSTGIRLESLQSRAPGAHRDGNRTLSG